MKKNYEKTRNKEKNKSQQDQVCKMESLRNKKILVWGLGVEGTSVVNFLKKNAIDFMVADRKPVAEDSNLKFIGEDKILQNTFDVVVKSPGISIYTPIAAELQKRGVVISSSHNIFLACVEEFRKKHNSIYPKTIAITGTKGKSTSATMLNHIFNQLALKSCLLGNIGNPLLETLDNLEEYRYLVVETSSYQATNLLYDFDYSILLNLFPEHINWHQTHENYFRDKSSIVKHSSIAIVNGGDERIKEYVNFTADNILQFNTDKTCHPIGVENGIEKICLNNQQIVMVRNFGEHISKNICALATLLAKENIDVQKALATLDNFETLEHRLEMFYNNPKTHTIFVNDSISTIPESTIEAIKTFYNYDIFLILGGFDRQQDYKNLIDFIIANKNIKNIYLMGQTGEKLNSMLAASFYSGKFSLHNNLVEITKAIKQEDLTNVAVLLSPAAASYDNFKNFQERGKLFKEEMLLEA